MDANQVLTCLQYTLSPSTEQRKQAETQLKQYERVNGYTVVLLKVVTSDQIDVNLRQSAAIVLKGLIRTHWTKDAEEANYNFDEHAFRGNNDKDNWIISNEDKDIIKTNLVEAIIHAPPKVRAQVALMLQYVVDSDFPANYPQIIPKITAFLTSQDLKLTYGALEALRRTVKKFEYMPAKKKKRQPLYELVNQLFPLLIQLFQAIAGLDTLEAAEMQFLLIRIFWSTINMCIPPFFHEEANLMPWMNQFLVLINRPIPAGGQPDDIEERPKSPWWKAKKWAASVFLRMFTRFGDPKMADNKAADQKFAKRFNEIYTPKLIDCFVGILSMKRTTYVTDRLLHISMTFLSSAVRRPNIYKMLRPNLDALLRELVFPLICFNEEDHRLWHEDPHEYIRKELDMMMDEFNPRADAINLVMDVGVSRSKNHLTPLMQFIASTLQKAQAENDARLKDGCLTVIGTLAVRFKKEPYLHQVEPLISTFVIPEYQSPHGFLRAKAAWFMQNFYEFPYSNPAIYQTCLRSTLMLLTDKELPVRITAALALKFLMQNDLALEDIQKNFQMVVEIFFSLMTEIDHDELVNSIETLVDRFADLIAPFAISMTQRLVDSFMRMYESDEDNAMIAAVECLNAIQSIMDAISEKPDLYPQMEALLLPLIHKLLEASDEAGSEFFEETLSIISFLSCYSPTISDNMWDVFSKMVLCFNRWGDDFVSNLLTPFDNYISRGTARALQGNYIAGVLEIYKSVVSNEDSFEDYATEAAKYIEIILLNCRGKVDNIIEPVVEIALKRINIAQRTSLKVSLLEVVAHGLFYNPVLLLKILEAHAWTQGFFATWLQYLHRFNRVHDKKVALLGLTALLSVPFGQLPRVVVDGMKHLLTTVIDLCFQIEKQRKDIEEENKKIEAELKEQEDDDEEWEEEEENETLQKLVDHAAAHAGEATVIGDDDEDEDEDFDDDDDLEDEDNFCSAIDDLDEIIYFIDTMREISARDPASYSGLISMLDAPVQKHYNDLVILSDKKKMEHQQRQLQQQQQLQQ